MSGSQGFVRQSRWLKTPGVLAQIPHLDAGVGRWGAIPALWFSGPKNAVLSSKENAVAAFENILILSSITVSTQIGALTKRSRRGFTPTPAKETTQYASEQPCLRRG